MGVFGGELGVVNGQSDVRNWNVTEAEGLQTFVASNTRRGSASEGGVRAWNGSFAQYGGVPVVLPGDQFTFKGITSPDNLVPGAAGEVVSGSAFLNQLTINWNWAGGEKVNMSSDFMGHLALAKTNEVQAADTAAPARYPAAGAKIQHSPDGVNWYDIPNLTTASLVLSAGVQSYANSSTVISGVIWTGRTRGPINWTLSLNQQDNKPGGTNGYPAIASIHQLRLYINAIDFWLLKWGKFGDYSGLQVDREAGTIIARTLNAQMDGYKDGVVGAITLPGAGSPWWPF